MFQKTGLVAAIILLATAFCGSLAAQQTIKRTILQKWAVPGSNYEAVLARAEIAPNAAFARHSHPGAELGYVLQGSLTLEVQGQPPLSLNAGQSFENPPRVVHWGHAGPAGVTVISTYVVEKGKPLASPAK